MLHPLFTVPLKKYKLKVCTKKVVDMNNNKWKIAPSCGHTGGIWVTFPKMWKTKRGQESIAHISLSGFPLLRQVQ